ncbi:hypothetical protein [Conchiformibius kuhniae]|uniref:Adhesin n=1 Tax=Conchiformibius kuhniae TaxID=211502 RepID=A0A8T9MSN5_9NEIS|nr:hypothetical protein [Conchiformibius kuhniae]UOP04617.1 hypothetical protein LVJ77_10365 [Conchiformibius kuhniae]
MKKLKQFNRALLAAVWVFACVAPAGAKSYRQTNQSGIISCAFEPKNNEVKFKIKWGSYLKTLSGENKSGGKVIFNFMDYDGAGLTLYIYPDKGSVIDCHRNLSLSQLEEKYGGNSPIEIFTCGRNKSC